MVSSCQYRSRGQTHRRFVAHPQSQPLCFAVTRIFPVCVTCLRSHGGASAEDFDSPLSSSSRGRSPRALALCDGSSRCPPFLSVQPFSGLFGSISYSFGICHPHFVRSDPRVPRQISLLAHGFLLSLYLVKVDFILSSNSADAKDVHLRQKRQNI